MTYQVLPRRRHAGFTLIELLVVIAIIAILAAILFPVFAKAREKARQTTCMNNQRQIAASIMMWTQDHDETLPEADTVWQNLNLEPQVLVCPTAEKRIRNGYVYVSALGGLSLGEITAPSDTYVIGDGDKQTTGTPNTLDAYKDWDYRHLGRLIIAFADGHVESTSDMLAPFPLVVTNGLYWWLRADKLFLKLKVGNNTQTWVPFVNNTGKTDASTTGNITGMPPLAASAMGGYPAVLFPTSPNRKLTDYGCLYWKDMERTVIIAFKPTDTSQGTMFDGQKNSSVRFAAGAVQIGGMKDDNNGTPLTFVTGPTVTANRNHYCVASWSRKDGVALCVDSPTSPVTDPTIIGYRNNTAITAIGSTYNAPDEWYRGYISEMIVYSRILNDNELRLIDRYMKSKYGI